MFYLDVLLPVQLFDRESEVCVREWLILQREVPPLGVEGLEAVVND